MCHDSTSQLAFVDSSAAIYPGQNQWTRGCGVGNQPNLPARPLFFPASIPNERTSFETGQATNGPWEGELYYLSIAETENPSYISTLPLFSCTAVFFCFTLRYPPRFRYPLSIYFRGHSLASRRKELNREASHHGSGIQYLPQFEQDLWMQSMQDASCGL